jgi:thioester reductase-like protein
LEKLKETRKHVINKLIVQYSEAIDALVASEDIKPAKVAIGDGPGHVVILTGSTGSLGSYLLQTLLQNQSVAHVYCLNRSSDSASLQAERNKSRGLPLEFPVERVTFLSAQLDQEHFGLEPALYDGLLRMATKVIINGWNVNFNVPLSSFHQQLEGIVNFSKFAHQSRVSPSVLFISSISSVKGLGNIEPIIPESILLDHSAPLPMGYGESKYIAERLLDYAAEKLFINAHIARVGQVAGPIHSSGTWSKREWLPSLVISSLHIGALPETLGASMNKIDWVPIDVLAEVLVELVLSAQEGSDRGRASVYHPHNPRTTSWTDLLPTIAKTLSAYKVSPVVIIPFEDWLKLIQADAESSTVDLDEGIKSNPAIKLLDFYEGLLRGGDISEMATDRAQRASSKLRDCGAVRPEWVEKWCRGWLEDL